MCKTDLLFSFKIIKELIDDNSALLNEISEGYFNKYSDTIENNEANILNAFAYVASFMRIFDRNYGEISTRLDDVVEKLQANIGLNDGV